MLTLAPRYRHLFVQEGLSGVLLKWCIFSRNVHEVVHSWQFRRGHPLCCSPKPQSAYHSWSLYAPCPLP